jgi:Domain of unknown function (DUF6398)
MVNFLFDSSQTPHLAASQIWEYFDLSSSTMQAKSKQIRDLLGMYPMAPDWSIPSMIDKNPLVWMLEVNGLIIDVHHAPRELQEAAFRKGLIPISPMHDHSLSKASRHTECVQEPVIGEKRKVIR